MASSLKEHYRHHPAKPCKVIASLKPGTEAGRTPTAPRLIVWVIGHEVSSVEVGRQHERNIHNPVNDSLSLRSKLCQTLEVKMIINLVIPGEITWQKRQKKLGKKPPENWSTTLEKRKKKGSCTSSNPDGYLFQTYNKKKYFNFSVSISLQVLFLWADRFSLCENQPANHSRTVEHLHLMFRC